MQVGLARRANLAALNRPPALTYMAEDLGGGKDARKPMFMLCINSPWILVQRHSSMKRATIRLAGIRGGA